MKQRREIEPFEPLGLDTEFLADPLLEHPDGLAAGIDAALAQIRARVEGTCW